MAQYTTDHGPLTDRSIAAYLRDAALPGPYAGEAMPESVARSVSFTVGRTRKGHWDIKVERRAGGKTVTVVRNVQGDAGALLKLLRRCCGAGGVARDGMVEVQGDHRVKVEEIIRAL